MSSVSFLVPSRVACPTLAVVNESSEAGLDALIARATVDCYNEDEDLAGFAVSSPSRSGQAPCRAGTPAEGAAPPST